METLPPNRNDRWAFPALFLAAFAFTLVGLNPTFFVDDSPETVTACVTLGIPHPPGYPLYTILGHFFSRLSLGIFPFRVNLLSALLSAGTCVFLFAFLKRKLGVGGPLAAVFSLLWAAGATTYPAALSAKTGIYELTALFLLALLWSFLSGRPAVAAFLLGLSFANHWMTMAAFLPGLAVLFFKAWKDQGAERRLWALWGAFFTLGLTLYLFLPLRAALEPTLDWGEPSSWHRFVFDFLRSQYGGAEGNGGWGVRFQEWWYCLKTAFLEFPGLALLALWGVRKALPENRTLVLGMGLMWLGLFLSLGAYLNLAPEEFYLLGDYLLPSQLLILLFSAWGVEKTLASASGARWKWAVVGLAVVFLSASAFVRYDRRRQTDYTYSYDYVLNAFKALPRNALFFCKGDAVVFPSWYFQWVEGRRTDLAVVGVDGLPMEWVRKNLAGLHPWFHAPFSRSPLGTESIQPLMEWIVQHNRELEVYFSYNQIEENSDAGGALAPYGLVERAFPQGEKFDFDEARARAIWDNLRLRHLREPGFPLDGRTDHWLARDYAIFRNGLGIFYENRADDAKARLGPRAKAQDLLAIERDYQESYDQFSWAQRWEPSDEKFNFNVGNSLFHLGRPAEAAAWYEKATESDPRYVSAFFNWAVTALQLQQYEKAGELFGKVLELDPGNAQAKQGLDYLAHRGQPAVENSAGQKGTQGLQSEAK